MSNESVDQDKGFSTSSRLLIAIVVFYATFKLVDSLAIELVAFLLATAVYLLLPKSNN
ncbi:putative membrane protein [Vibrio cholerae]|nr:putative membrane protein [Vibrio cholerae]